MQVPVCKSCLVRAGVTEQRRSILTQGRIQGSFATAPAGPAAGAYSDTHYDPQFNTLRFG